MDESYLVAGIDNMKGYKSSELVLLSKILQVDLDSFQVGYLEGFFMRPMNPTLSSDETDHLEYLEGYGSGADDRRELNQKFKGGRE